MVIVIIYSSDISFIWRFLTNCVTVIVKQRINLINTVFIAECVGLCDFVLPFLNLLFISRGGAGSEYKGSLSFIHNRIRLLVGLKKSGVNTGKPVCYN